MPDGPAHVGADRLHVVHRPAGLPGGIDWRAADAADPDAASDAAKDAAVVYQCLNAPYTQWPERFPPLQRGVLTAAERTGALLVTLENLYGYGPAGGKPMTEDLPLAATTVKGRTRAAMTRDLLVAAEAGRVRIAIGRASDFFGPGVTEGSTLGERVFGNALAGRRADFIGHPDLPHTYSYVPDIAAGLATLGTDDRSIGGVWHLPGPATVTTREILRLIAIEVGHPVGVRSVPKLAVRALGLVSPMMRALAEMSYEFDVPFIRTPAGTSPRLGRPARRWLPPSPRRSPGTGTGPPTITEPKAMNAVTSPANHARHASHTRPPKDPSPSRSSGERAKHQRHLPPDFPASPTLERPS
jgi:nucleoside-diphosphate-sugar epimerase